MRSITIFAVFFFTVLSVCAHIGAQQQVELRERWETPYTGNDATGAHVLGLWTFDGDKPTTDASPHSRPGALQGAEIDSDGRFGGCLRTFRGWPVDDKQHRLLIKNDPTLTPKGPFTIELWVNADVTLADYPQAFLIDKKYVAHADYQLILQNANRSGTRTLQANLGFGTQSVSWNSDPITVEPGRWYHVAFTYDADGTGRFFVDGHLWGKRTVEGLGAVARGTHPLSIGDRIGSYYHGFPGRIDQVRITSGAREFRPIRLERVSDRTCYRRMENNAVIRFRMLNLDHRDMRDARVTWSLDGRVASTQTIDLLASGAFRELSFPLDTSLRADHYRLEAAVSWSDDQMATVRDTFAIQITPRPIPDQFPVVMWGAGPTEVERLKRIGFTHALGIGADYARIWEAGKPTQPVDDKRLKATRDALDRALGEGISFCASLSPGSYLRGKKELVRVDRSQQPYTGREDICCLFPQIGPYFRNVGKSVANAYGDLPAFGAALIDTEVRDAAQLCFHQHDRDAYRAATGLEIPPEATTKWGTRYEKLNAFPKDRVIPDDHPLYRYYRWYWKKGDGWNNLHSQLHLGLQTMERKDFWTWNDPAVRVASVFGSGGDVDVISQWTYSYPDPIRIGVATDELLAMARGADHQQQVMKMTQIIWYRSQTAPMPKKGTAQDTSYRARWEREQPDAPFITIAPMHLREAFWTKIARPIKGIMYHGWQSLVPVEGVAGYRFTHPETQHELQRLVRTVVQPLGPTLLQVPAVQTDVAFYESFAAEMFAGRGTYGWSGKWQGDAHLIAQWAGLQPEVVFDETIQQRGLQPYKLLFMMNCDVVTQSVAENIKQFQRRGGIVIGDENIVPAITPDIVLPIVQRTGNAAADKSALLTVAAQLRTELASLYERYVETDNPEVIPYRRRFAKADYVFLINDHREYGHYVGHHRRVMEDGLPSRATLRIRQSGAHVYDLVRHQEVATASENGTTAVTVQLGPCEGRLLMVTPQMINRVTLEAPAQIERGTKVEIDIRVVANDGKPISAVVPIELSVEDPTTRQAEYSGHWAAIDGKLRVTLDIAPNDPAGTWTVRARELASGQSATGSMRLQRELDATPATIDEDAANPVQPNG